MANLRSPYGEGSQPRLRKDGRWECRLSLGKDSQGRRTVRSFFGRTEREARQKRNEAKRELYLGRMPADKLTVERFLKDWLVEVSRRKVSKRKVRSGTLRMYTSYVENHLIPSIGHLSLTALDRDPMIVQKMLNQKEDRGLGRHGVGAVRAVLCNALKYAVRMGYISRNVASADFVAAPELPKSRARSLSFAETQRFIRSIANDPWRAFFMVGLTGLRIGEALALRRTDIDFSAQTITVRASLDWEKGRGFVLGDPKTESSKAPIPVPQVVLDALMEHLETQKSSGLLPGPPWEGLVFTSKYGIPIHQARGREQLRRALRKAGVPQIRYHDLRHSSYSLMHAMGVPLKTGAQMLRHRHFEITEGRYTHVIDETMRDAAETLNKILSGKANGDRAAAETASSP